MTEAEIQEVIQAFALAAARAAKETLDRRAEAQEARWRLSW